MPQRFKLDQRGEVNATFACQLGQLGQQERKKRTNRSNSTPRHSKPGTLWGLSFSSSSDALRTMSDTQGSDIWSAAVGLPPLR